MELPQLEDHETGFDPMDMVETILNEEGLDYEQSKNGDICFSLNGGWKPYDMWFSWQPAGECLQLCCGLGAKDIAQLPRERLLSLYELLSLVNQRVWFGHFEIYQEREDLYDAACEALAYRAAIAKPNEDNDASIRNADIVFRHVIAVTPLERPSILQMAHMINQAAEAVDCFFPAFDLWLSSSQSNNASVNLPTAQGVLDACLFETVGEA